ncbi:MAG: hypothetical protein ACOH12_05595 [Parvibaculaceae bacterium]
MHDIDFGALLPLVNEFFMAALTGLGSLAVAKICLWLKAKRDGELGLILDKALAMGIAFAGSRLATLNGKAATLDVKSEMVADAANYVLVQVPDAVKALGLTGEHLTRMIEARLQASAVPAS